MFKRQQNVSTYGKSVTVTERVFTKRTLGWRFFFWTVISYRTSYKL